MKYLKHFASAQEAATILATWPFNTISSIQGQEGASFSEGVPVVPVVPTDRIILKFMVTAEDWNDEAQAYKKQLVGENCGNPFYDGSCFNYMIKDNERIDKDFWSQFIYFDTLGEHTVELIFDEEFDGHLPYNCLRVCDMHEAIISSNVISIGADTFHSCTGLTSISIPNSVTTIYDEAFKNCSSLTSVTIPDGVTTIGNSAFQGCSGLTSVNIPAGVTSIEAETFLGCSSLTAVSIPSGVTSIGEGAFAAMNSLTSVNIPSTVTTINYGAFRDCGSLTSITCNAINPPYPASSVFSASRNCPIYVPASSVDAYKAADGWSKYADRIQAIQS